MENKTKTIQRAPTGPDFDDRLIQLVRQNPAIYDVSHPNYRRNPVRVAIWDRIASELNAPSRFLQTKWKNIRYNYLQEVKALETGITNTNIRKRRFTEDLSFLQRTAQSYNVKKGMNSTYNSSDNDSNSFIYTDLPVTNSYEVIELDQSDDGASPNPYNSNNGKQQQASRPYFDDDEDNDERYGASMCEAILEKTSETLPEPSPLETKHNGAAHQTNHSSSRTPSRHSENSLSPLLTPMVVLGNGTETEEPTTQFINGFNDEVTIKPLNKQIKIDQSAPPPLHQFNRTSVKRKLISYTTPTNFSNNDPIEMYCMSLADCLRAMPRSERERVKFEFASILKDAQYKNQS